MVAGDDVMIAPPYLLGHAEFSMLSLHLPFLGATISAIKAKPTALYAIVY
jgi:hypothetical protein